MVYGCCVCNKLPKKTSKLSFFRFPKDEIMCEAWFRTIQKPRLKQHTAEYCWTNLRICSNHFRPDDINDNKIRRTLKLNALPVFIYGVEDPSLNEKQIMRNRFNSLLLRRKKGENKHLITRVEFVKLLEEIKNAKTCKIKATLDRWLIKNYDILKTDKEEKLCVPLTNAKSGVVFYCVSDEMFDILYDVHVSYEHCGKDSMLFKIKQRYINIFPHDIELFLSLCKKCEPRKNQDQKEETTKSSKDWEELCEVVYGKARWQSFSEEEKAEKKILVIEKYLPLQAGQSEHKQDSESEAGPSSAKCSRFDDDSSLNSLISGHDADDIPLDSPSYVTVKNITKLSDNTYVSQPIKTEEILIKEEPIDESMQEECLNNTLPPITLPQTTIPDQIMLASLPANNQQNVVLFNTISSPPPLCFTQNTYSKAKNVSSLVTKTIQGTSSDIQSTKSIHKPLEQLLTHLFPNETASMKDQLVIDEDVLFILSLISSIKKISESNRLAVKADFLNVLKKYQNN